MSSLTDQFVHEVERRILTGEWQIGARIPPLRTLAAEFCVSRSVINAGIAELVNNGYLTTSPRRYICVSDWRTTGNFQILTGLMEHDLCDERFFGDLLEGRMTITRAIVARAAERRTDEDLALLSEIIDSERIAVTPEQCAREDNRFHHALATAAHNVVYSAIFNSFRPLSHSLTLRFYERTDNRRFVIDIHVLLLDALRAQDSARAEQLIEILLKHGESAIDN